MDTISPGRSTYAEEQTPYPSALKHKTPTLGQTARDIKTQRESGWERERSGQIVSRLKKIRDELNMELHREMKGNRNVAT